MFSNLKAFIRHGRNAKDMKESDFSSSHYNSGGVPHHESNNHAAYDSSSNRQMDQQNVDLSSASAMSHGHGVGHTSNAAQSSTHRHHDSQQQGQREHKEHREHREHRDHHEHRDHREHREHHEHHGHHGASKEPQQQHTQQYDPVLTRYDDAAAKICQEERANRSRASKYPGLENYEVLEKMGEGAFSVVYKARHLVSNKLVAIKVLRKFQMDRSQKQAVLKEVTIMRQLKHPNIVRFIEVIESESYYYIVQELAMGGEIFAAIVNFTYLSEDLSRHIIYQVAESVRYLHEEVGVVHRDIKPENLLFQPIAFRPSLNPFSKLRRSDDPKTKKDEGEFVPGIGGGTIGVVKLADFGLSKQIWEHNTKTPCGTVGYTAPEIVRDERYSKEVDMWAIGCVLYTLLCGFPPFYDERIESLTEKVARGKYSFLAPWWDEISDEAKFCVSRLLTVDPKKRYTINDLLNDPWLSKAKKPSSAIVEQAKKDKVHPAKFAAYQNEALYSPAALALREAFDISAAVHRIGEEAALQKGLNNVPEVVMEESEEPDLFSAPVSEVRELNSDNGFALNLGGASILGRRKNKPVAA